MRVSREKKNEIKRLLIRTAVDLFIEKGFSQATMREISTRAGLSAGTIYNYFPNKERIFYAYFDLKQEELQQLLEEVAAFETFTLKEKLQTLLESLLEVYTDDREFVAVTYKALLDSPMRSYTELGLVKEKFTHIVRVFLADSVASGAIPQQPFEGFLANIFWDYSNLVVLYWLKDESEGFVNSSRFIDLSLDLYVDMITSGIVTKAADLVSFLLKSHIYGNIDRIYNLISVIATLRQSESSSNNNSPLTENDDE